MKPAPAAPERRAAPWAPVFVLTLLLVCRLAAQDPAVSQAADPSQPDDSVIDLSAPVTELEVAGDGRYLVLALEGFKGLKIYDADTCRIVQTITLSTDRFVYAAGGDVVLVSTPEDGVITSYNLITGERIKAKPQPSPGELVRMVMGRNRSDKALMRISSGGERHVTTFNLHLLDVPSMREVPCSIPNRYLEATPEIARHDGVSVDDSGHLRANSDLTQIGDCCTKVGPSGVELIQLKLTEIDFLYRHESAGVIIPADDGLVYTGNGRILDAGLKNRRGLTDMTVIPGYGGILYLTMDFQGKITVYRSGENTPIGSLAAYPGLEQQPRPQPNGFHENIFAPSFSTTDMSIDKRVLFDPPRGRLIMLPEKAHQLVQRTFDLKSVLDKAGGEYLVVLSHPPAAIPRGKPFNFQISAISHAGHIAYQLQSGPGGLTVSATGLIAWTPDASSSPRESVIIQLTDKSGEQRFLTFDLFVDD